MNSPEIKAAILHKGRNKALFGDLPEYLSRKLEIPIVESDEKLELAYLLAWDEECPINCSSFVPVSSIKIAHDKRIQAKLFIENEVQIPETYLLNTKEEVYAFISSRCDKKWLLKWPTGCGAIGHMFFTAETKFTKMWSPPYLLQEFICLSNPEVYRICVIEKELFGWFVRYFPDGVKPTPWVAVAQGAKAKMAGNLPKEVEKIAQKAFQAVGLYDNFGGCDFIKNPDGRWMVLEVNTDGIYNFIPRQIEMKVLEDELNKRLKEAIRKRIEINH